MGDSEYRRPGRLSGGLSSLQTPGVSVDAKPETREEIYARINHARDMSKIRTVPAAPNVNPFDSNTRKRVVIYCRVSTDNLAQAPSFATQQRYYLNYVRKRPDWQMVAMYADEGISATSMDKRMGLLRMIKDAESGKFDIVVVKNLSRLSRNLMDCMRIIYHFRSFPKPVGILFETENMFTLDRNVDFTLQILSLLAQEESHKRSEAITAAQRQRYEQGNFIIKDILGYDRVGVNKIAVNEEEAKTVQLIFMMYMAGCDPELIAEVLVMLGRKKHTHHYLDGRVKEGTTDWTRSSVMNVLKNEKRCGDVHAQKTVTPNYLDHKSVKNVNQAPQYYAVDQHPAIIDPQDFYLAQRMVSANCGGWKHGLQEMELYRQGLLAGSVSAVPNWMGFTAEDYNRASLRAHGVEEAVLDGIAYRISQEKETQDKEIPKPTELPTMVEINSDDYEHFPDTGEAEDAGTEEGGTKEPKESFGKWVQAMRQDKAAHSDIDKEAYSPVDLSDAEVARAELFSMREKICFTMDRSGISFNKRAFQRMGGNGEVMQVTMAFNPVEQMIIVRKAEENAAKTLKWVRESNDRYTMKRCGCKGIASAIFSNMGWNTDYKYRVTGRALEYADETMLVFFLEEPVSIVPAKPHTEEEAETSKTDRKKAKEMFMDGFLPYGIVLPNLEEFDLGDGPLATQAKNIAKSRAIYYDSNTNKKESELTLADLGDGKYAPERIRHMLQRGLSPVESWSYLRGMAVFGDNKFTIYPCGWADCFGDNIYGNMDTRLNGFVSRHPEKEEEPIPYGWTVGLDLPTMETVRKTIEILRQEMATAAV